VNDDQTLPFYAAQDAPNFMPYNFGVGGCGAQQMYLRLRDGKVREIVQEPSGMGIYVFIGGHIRRAIGSMRVYSMWARAFPCVEEQDGQLVIRGSFQSAHPWRGRLYDLLSYSQTIRYLNIDIPWSFREQDFRLVARIVNESYLEFNRQFPDSVFCILVFPGSSLRAEPGLIPLLDPGIRVLRYQHLLDDAPFPVTFADSHPTPQVYREVAKALTRDMGIGVDITPRK
jgi:hypothetical protein